MTTCPRCGADGAYVGLTKVECGNPQCECYVAPAGQGSSSRSRRELLGLPDPYSAVPPGFLKWLPDDYKPPNPSGPCTCPLCTDARRAASCDDVDAAVGAALSGPSVPAWFRAGQLVRARRDTWREPKTIEQIDSSGRAWFSNGGVSWYTWPELEPVVDAPDTKCWYCAGDATDCTTFGRDGEPLCRACRHAGHDDLR